MNDMKNEGYPQTKCICRNKPESKTNLTFVVNDNGDYRKETYFFCEDCAFKILYNVRDTMDLIVAPRRKLPYYMGLPRWYIKWYIKHWV